MSHDSTRSDEREFEASSETDYDDDGVRILWGRLIALGVVVLLGFFLGLRIGRATAPDGLSQTRYDTLQERLTSAQGKLAATEDRLAATEDKLAATQDELATTQDELAAAEERAADLQAQADATTPEPAESPAPLGGASPTADERGKTYTVKPGDTLQAIATKFYDDATLAYFLARENGITDASAMPIGIELTIPPKP